MIFRSLIGVKLFLLLFFSVAPLYPVFSQDVGLAFFAMPSPKFPCEAALAPFKESDRPALAILWGTFGKDLSCLKRWSEVIGTKPHLLEIHISNEACRRNKRCLESDFLPHVSVAQLNRKLEARDTEVLSHYTALIQEITSSLSPLFKERGEYLISTGLEDNFSTKAYDSLLATVKEAWPHKVVRSPVGSPSKVKLLSADYIEGHGPAPTFREGEKCIANLDGDDIVFPHRKAGTSRIIHWEALGEYVRTYSSRCRSTFLWAGPWQGLHSDTFIPPLDRNYMVSDEDMKALRPFLNSVR
jgi:hypothetical protein